MYPVRLNIVVSLLTIIYLCNYSATRLEHIEELNQWHNWYDDMLQVFQSTNYNNKIIIIKSLLH